MRILMDARRLVHPRTGIGRYIGRLATELSSLGCEITLGTDGKRRDLPDAFARYSMAYLGSELARRRIRGAWDVIHLTYPLAAPPRSDLPTVATLYDVLYLHKEWAGPSKRFMYRMLFQRYLRSSDALVSISQYSLDDAVQMGLTLPKLCAVTPLAPGIEFFEGSDSTSSDVTARDPTMLLYVGNLKAHKNVELILRALTYLDAAFTLTISTSDDPRQLLGEAAALGVSDRVRIISSGTDETLKGLYLSAGCVVCPSKYEGFGLPAVEALAAGAPLVTSDIPAFAEVTTPAVPKFPPTDPNALASAVLKVAVSPPPVETFPAIASWRGCALSTYDIYRRVIRAA